MLTRTSKTMLLRWLHAQFPDVLILPDAQFEEAITKPSSHSDDIVTK